MAEPSYRRFVVGYALLPKKQQSFIRPSLVGTARDRGVDLVPIDPVRPLVEQGPFDCVIHKLHGDDWKIQLADFAAKNPGVPIVDKPLDIEPLRNRITMLQFVSKIDIPHGAETFGVPNQVLVHDSSSVSSGMTDLGRFPMIAKPLVSVGSAKSHTMSLIFTCPPPFRINPLVPLRWVEPPLVLQEFINHGGVIFKVYVAGDYVQCVRRKSLPDTIPGEQHGIGALAFTSPSKTPWDNPEDKDIELPPSSFLEKIAMGLRQATGLHLFNFDMIRDANASNHYYIIDINYFPGYSKMPGYEEFMTNFFWDMVRQKGESAAATD